MTQSIIAKRIQIGVVTVAALFINYGQSPVHWLQADSNIIIVNTNSDDPTICASSGKMCLRNAVTIADTNVSATTINFENIGVITLDSTLIFDNTLGNPITVVGASIDGRHAVEIFRIGSGSEVTFNQVELQNGSSVGGGAVYNRGSLALDHCSLSGNTAIGGSGGAIWNDTEGNLTISATTFSGNTATEGSAGAIFNLGNLLVRNSTFVKNSAKVFGGALQEIGAMEIDNSTFTENYASEGGGLFSASLTAASLYSTIVAGNIATIGPDVRLYSGQLISRGHNLIGDGTGWADRSGVNIINGVNGDQVGTSDMPINPKFDNTYSPPRLLPDSSAIGHGECNVNVNGISTMAAPVTPVGIPQSTLCDIGANENTGWSPVSPVPASTSTRISET